MVRPAIRRTLLAVAALLVVPLGLAAPAEAAKTPRAYVTITSPRDGTSGPADVTVSGKAVLPPLSSLRLRADTQATSLAVTVSSRGTWSVLVEDLPLGWTSLCAEIYDAGGGYVTASCVRYQVTPTPGAFSLDAPADREQVGSSYTVRGLCEGGSVVTVTTDFGYENSTSCDAPFWQVDVLGAPTGATHTTTATASFDGVTIASRTVTLAVAAVASAAVDITSPADGTEILTGRSFVLLGTATPGATVLVAVDGAEPVAGVWADDTGAWSLELSAFDPGTSQYCARVEDIAGGVAEDCVSITVVVDPESLTVNSPADGLLTRETSLLVTGACYTGTTVEVAVGSFAETVQCAASYGVFATGLVEGQNTITVTARWQGDLVATRSLTVVVDTVAPAPPVITSPAPGSTITSAPSTLVGTSEPGSVVEVLLPDEMGYATTTADESGAWSVVLGRDYFEYAGVLTGRRASLTIPVRSSDAAGNGALPATYTYTTRLR